MRRRIVAMSVAGALWPDPSLRAAAPSPTVDAPPPVEVDPLAAAKEQHAEGQARFDAANYTGAIESWTAALKALPSNDDRSAPYRPYILYNIAAAREKLYAIEGDVSQLRQARILLERFEASIDEVYGDNPETAETERKRVREKLAALDASIAQHEVDSRPATDPAPKTDPEVTTSDVTPTKTDTTTPDKNAVGLSIGGGVMVGVGLAALGGLIASLVIGKKANVGEGSSEARRDQFKSGERANKAAIAMGILSPLFLAGGIAMLVVGAKRSKKKNVSLVPSVGGRFAGVVLRGRF